MHEPQAMVSDERMQTRGHRETKFAIQHGTWLIRHQLHRINSEVSHIADRLLLRAHLLRQFECTVPECAGAGQVTATPAPMLAVIRARSSAVTRGAVCPAAAPSAGTSSCRVSVGVAVRRRFVCGVVSSGRVPRGAGESTRRRRVGSCQCGVGSLPARRSKRRSTRTGPTSLFPRASRTDRARTHPAHATTNRDTRTSTRIR